MFDLTGRVAIVTGGNGGIGFGMARGLAKVGARVVVAARNQEKSAEAVRELRALGSDSLAIQVDVADEGSVDALVNKTMNHCGRLDILINNAGINVRKPPHELTLDEWSNKGFIKRTPPLGTSQTVGVPVLMYSEIASWLNLPRLCEPDMTLSAPFQIEQSSK